MVFPQHLYGVIGWPLGQSLSPLLHNTGFQALSLPAVYLAWPVPPKDLSNFVANMGLYKIDGLSVTIPHKQTIMPLLTKISQEASLAGAVNTLYWEGDSLCGDNTDVNGFLTPLRLVPLADMRILLLGAGGAAHAAAAGLSLAGCKAVWITSPANKRQYPLAERFNFTPLIWQKRQMVIADLIINATPAGMYGHTVDETCYDFAQVAGRSGWAYDLVYNPLETRFLEEAARAGWHCISGLDMFLSQGAAQFRIWSQRELPSAAREEVVKVLRSGPNDTGAS